MKAKCPDFKLLSVQFEQEAKVESEKKKMANLKRRQELHEKMEIDFRNNRSGSDHSQRSFYDKGNNSLMESIYVVKNEVTERRQVIFISNLNINYINYLIISVILNNYEIFKNF